eukprot:Gb_07915 [translate_table: standard]
MQNSKEMGGVRHRILPIFWVIVCVNILQGESQIISDAQVLVGIKQTLQGGSDNLLLSSWNSSVPFCAWRGIQWAHEDGSLLDCSNSSMGARNSNLTVAKNPSLVVYSIQLPAAGLAGTIPKEIGKLSHLEKLYLGVNMLTGPIPLEIGNSASLASLSLSGNKLNGSIPPSIWNLCGQLLDLLLEGNDLGDSIPEPALPNVTCPHLQILDLSNNHLQGPVPVFLANFQGLQELDLSKNSLSGPIPQALAHLNLSSLNLASNNLSGPIPIFPQSFGNQSFAGNNPSLCGSPLVACAGPTSNKRSGLSSGAVAGIVIALMAALVVLVSILIGLGTASNGKMLRGNPSFNQEFEDEEAGEGRLVLFEGGEHLTVEDVLNATGQVLGKTSYGTVYKAKLTQGGTIALRLLREGACKEREAFLPVIKDLGRLRHENIVPLRAFYEGQRGEKLLVYDYLLKGSLADLLHDARGGRPALSWARRHKIALGAARGLAHLHTGLETPIIHGNLKSKNVLVDEYYVAHLTDYGLDRLMTPASAAEMMGAATLEGYRAPELQKMKKANTKTDIYSFGIFLLEILMGKRPGKSKNSDEFVDLPSIVKTAVLEESILELFDVEVLRGMRSPVDDGLLQALQLAMGCCAPSPSVRPDIKAVVRQLEEIRPKIHSALYTPTPTDTRSELELPF